MFIHGVGTHPLSQWEVMDYHTYCFFTSLIFHMDMSAFWVVLISVQHSLHVSDRLRVGIVCSLMSICMIPNLYVNNVKCVAARLTYVISRLTCP